jgi:hypothetical protein
MKSLFRAMALLLTLFALTQSARTELACGAASGDAMSGMPANHHMDGHSSPTRTPQHHPCGPMSGALCQMMAGCLDFGAPAVAFQVSLPSVASAATESIITRAVPLNDLAPPLTPPRA